MKWYRSLFELSFTYSPEKIKESKARVRQLKQDFRKVLFSKVCRSLFEQHKLMFAFSMAIKLNTDDGSQSGGQDDNFNRKLKELEQM